MQAYVGCRRPYRGCVNKLLNRQWVCEEEYLMLTKENKKKPLPKKPSKVAKLEFTGPKEGWPPRPKGYTNVKKVPWKEIPGSLTDALEAQIRQAALQDKRVRDLLGERFAYISTAEIEPAKNRPCKPTDPLPTRVTFFSYTKNVAVEVYMNELKVEKVKRKKKYQPPEGDDEIKQAIALAQSDDHLRDKVQNLTGDAILIPTAKDRPNYGRCAGDPDQSALLVYQPVGACAVRLLSCYRSPLGSAELQEGGDVKCEN
jgi:hypothetical protein